MSDVDLDRLREPFKADRVGLLPKLTCKACSDKNCQQHSKQRCGDCGNWISTAHIHLDYVGHGAVTERLLDVDPGWTWEPVAWDEQGLPRMERDRNGNPFRLWIWLTVGGIRRLGCGTCNAGQFDAEKVLIGDALRNAAMRFGVALDLWIKGHAEDDEAASASDDRRGPERATGNTTPLPFDPERFIAVCTERGVDPADVLAHAAINKPLTEITPDEKPALMASLDALSAAA